MHSQSPASVLVHVFTVGYFVPGHSAMHCIWQFCWDCQCSMSDMS